MAKIELSDVTVAYDGRPVLDSVSLTVADGEFLVLVGPSGCGKTTALRVVAGLLSPISGQVLVDGADVTRVAPADRDLAMVFQSYALYPHMTVRRNMEFGLRLAHVDRRERAARVARAADVLGLAEMLDRRPKALSGGQRQRVAMGRAIVRQPRAFLMDEPLSNLDAKLRVRMRVEIARIQRSLGTTTLYVTHDQTEAMTMADRIAVLHEGSLQQVGTPTDLFDRPANLFVAAFIGSPPTNFVPGRLTNGGGATLRVGEQSLVLPAELATALGAATTPDVLVGIRPHDLSTSPDQNPALRLDMSVDLVERLGTDTLAHGEVSAEETAGAAAQAASAMVTSSDDDFADFTGDPTRTRLTAALGAHVTVTVGQQLPLYAPLERIHLFDAETGATLRHAERTLASA